METKILELLTELGLDVISVRIDSINTHAIYPCRIAKGEVKTNHTTITFILPVGLEDLKPNVTNVKKANKPKKPE